MRIKERMQTGQMLGTKSIDVRMKEMQLLVQWEWRVDVLGILFKLRQYRVPSDLQQTTSGTGPSAICPSRHSQHTCGSRIASVSIVLHIEKHRSGKRRQVTDQQR